MYHLVIFLILTGVKNFKSVKKLTPVKFSNMTTQQASRLLSNLIQIRRYDTWKTKNVIFQTSTFRKSLQTAIEVITHQKYNNIEGGTVKPEVTERSKLYFKCRQIFDPDTLLMNGLGDKLCISCEKNRISSIFEHPV